jgi:hypothetical protein
VANDVVSDENMLHISGLNTNWDMAVSGGLADVDGNSDIYGDNKDYNKGPKTNSIQFDPGAADDELFIRHKTATGPIIFHCKGSDDKDQRIRYYHGQRVRPYIKYSECTLSAGHAIQIHLWVVE